MSGIQDRAVAGAATQIAVKGLLDVMLARAVVVPQQSIQAHNNARGAEATLASVALGDPLLCWVRLLHIANAFDRDDVFTVEARQRRQAGIDAGMVDLLGRGIVLRDDDGASTASAFGAAAATASQSSVGRWRRRRPAGMHMY